MKPIYADALTFIASLLCSLLLLHYFTGTLGQAGFPHPFLCGCAVVGMVTAAVFLLTKTFRDLAGKYFYLAVAGIFLLAWLIWNTYPNLGVAAATGIALYRSFALVLVLSGAIYVLSSANKSKPFTTRMRASTFWVITTIIATVTALSLLWFSFTDFVWCWDYSGYSDITKNLFNISAASGLKNAVLAIAASLKNEYNYIPAIPLLGTELVFGTTARSLYIFAIALFYTAPTILIMAYLLHNFSQQKITGRLALLIAIIVLCLFPITLQNGLYGMPDIGGLIFLGALIACSFADDNAYDAKRQISLLILTAAFLFLLCVFRRWYIFVALPLMVLKIISELQKKPSEGGVKLWRERFLRLAILGSALLLIGVCFYWDRFLVMFNGGYHEAYHAYSRSILAYLKEAFACAGAVPLAIGFLSIAYLAIKKETRKTACAITFVLVTAAVLFLHIQGFSTQHYLLVLPTLSYAVGLAITRVYISNKKYGHIAIAAVTIISLASFDSMLHPAGIDFLQKYRVLPVESFAPPQRPDMAELRLMVHQLGSYAAAGKNVCAAVSGMDVNQSTISIVASDSNDASSSILLKKFLPLGDVDRRDGPAFNFPECDYVVITNPVSVNLLPHEQEVIAYLSENISAQKGLGKAYRSTGMTYPLMDGYQATIYEKTGSIDPADWQDYLRAVQNKQ